ncbi:hypothetical protein CC80DRAFT_549680 [Byssothecium circinans]|uniref:Uncharacterized protein n=1 Tax=Byssothecium circinans TaxID=147558 RepID=A0A6A5TQQ3_9PLEO|nr:hypothetical protein CC80DRAFT_549680 [Byssothecium circinans]
MPRVHRGKRPVKRDRNTRNRTSFEIEDEDIAGRYGDFAALEESFRREMRAAQSASDWESESEDEDEDDDEMEVEVAVLPPAADQSIQPTGENCYVLFRTSSNKSSKKDKATMTSEEAWKAYVVRRIEEGLELARRLEENCINPMQFNTIEAGAFKRQGHDFTNFMKTSGKKVTMAEESKSSSKI